MKKTNNAKEKLENRMRSNQKYCTDAEKSAELKICNMVEKLNFDIDNLKIEVEFME